MSSILIKELLEVRRKNFERIVKTNGIKQVIVAKRYGCESSYIGELIKGDRRINDDTLFKLLKALKGFNITIDDFHKGLEMPIPGELIDKAITNYLPYAHEEDKKTIYRVLVRCVNPPDEASKILSDFFKPQK